MAKCIVFTGGGTAGHVTVNLSLIPMFYENGWDIHYIGSKKGMERRLVTRFSYVTYHSIPTGKLRRYFDVKNALDIFKVFAGCAEALFLLKKVKPDVIFSKGGYVSFPVVFAGSKNRIPVIAHESDFSPGLANRLSARYTDAICLTFPETSSHIKGNAKSIYIGPVVRPDIFNGNRRNGLKLCSFSEDKPIIMAVGGSSGAQTINNALRAELPELLTRFRVIHLCGKGNADNSLNKEGYVQFEYADENFSDLLAAADIIISRAGSNAIFEFLALRKPMLLIPLAANSSRGDQIENARRFETNGYARVLLNEDCMGNIFKQTMHVYKNAARYIENMESSGEQKTSLKRLYDIIAEYA